MDTVIINNQMSDEGMPREGMPREGMPREGMPNLFDKKDIKSNVYVIDVIKNEVEQPIHKSRLYFNSYNTCQYILFLINILLCVGLGISIWLYDKYNTTTNYLTSSFNEIMLNIIFILAVYLLVSICIFIRVCLISTQDRF